MTSSYPVLPENKNTARMATPKGDPQHAYRTAIGGCCA